ncbi:phosphatidate cytidylyltransferase [Sphingomicrobium aestuariivivum]|uniref:phosphatidate cytidylyltransferase n=1 Tax=Sphingomicrobium aestuariivivum TaxID=1582356 RepID=UPI001FD66C2C|nr:phosphatidate cytidylyltransferase [Sphingomicrobium aestuariivivum]MCJ8189806.1 phosphatidate cytidylyltransferase [Sphingomicrobium aestuariivivum]
MNELTVRSIAGVAMIAITLATAWVGGMVFAVFVAALATAVYWEWSRIVTGWNIGWKIAGFFYCLVPALALLWIRDRYEFGFDLLVWVFIVTWATDIGGYAFGKTWGRNKLAPTISPNKTWEGLIGGMVAAGILGGLWALSRGLDPMLYWLGAPMAVAAQMGDLFESGMKRRAGVKDSGNLLPGHGGVFDRVDGLLVVATAVGLAVYMGWL